MLKSVLKVTEQYKNVAKLVESNKISLSDFCKKYDLDELAEINKDSAKPSSDLPTAMDYFKLFYLYQFENKAYVFKALKGMNVSVFESNLRDFTLKVLSATDVSSGLASSFFDYEGALKELLEKGYMRAILVYDEDSNQQGLALVYGLPEPMTVSEIDTILENYPDVSTIPYELQVNIVLLFKFLDGTEKSLSRVALLNPKELVKNRVLLEKLRPLAKELYNYVRID